MAKCKRVAKGEGQRIFKTSCVLRRCLPQVERLVTRPMIIRHIVEHIKRKNLRASKDRYCHLDATLAAICDLNKVPRDPVKLLFLQKCLSKHLLPLNPEEIQKYQRKIDRANKPYTVTEDGYVCRKRSEEQEREGDDDRSAKSEGGDDDGDDGGDTSSAEAATERTAEVGQLHLSNCLPEVAEVARSDLASSNKNVLVVPSTAGLSAAATLGEFEGAEAAAKPQPLEEQPQVAGSDVVVAIAPAPDREASKAVGVKRNWGCPLQ